MVAPGPPSACCPGWTRATSSSGPAGATGGCASCAAPTAPPTSTPHPGVPGLPGRGPGPGRSAGVAPSSLHLNDQQWIPGSEPYLVAWVADRRAGQRPPHHQPGGGRARRGDHRHGGDRGLRGARRGVPAALPPGARREPGGEPLERRAVISGIGQSQVGRRLGRTELDLTVEASLRAIADAGLTRDDIDGISTYPGMGMGTPGFAGPGTPEVQDALRLQLNWHDGGGEGPAQMRAVIAACLAVGAGLARHVLVYRTVTESRPRAREADRASAAAGAAGAGCPASGASCSGTCRSAPCRRPTGSPWWPSAGSTNSG